MVLRVVNPSASASPSLIRSRTQSRVGTPCAPASELPQSKHRNAQNPSPDTPSTQSPQAPAAAKRASRPAPDHPPPKNSPKPRPRFRPTMAAVGWTVPSPRFHPHQGTLSRQPTRPRPAHGLVEPHSLQPSPRIAARHLQRQGPSYCPHPTPPPRISPLSWNPQQPRIQPRQPLVREDIRSSNDVHNFDGDTVNTLK